MFNNIWKSDILVYVIIGFVILICLKVYSESDVYNLKCGTNTQLHIYHKICLEKWNKQCCPYCRKEIM